MKLLATTALTITLTACVPHPTVKTDQAKNQKGIPKRYDVSPAPVPEITNSLLKLFPDSNLRYYINRATTHNPDLKLAAARLEEAGYNTRRAQSGLSPTLTSNSSISRSQTNSAGTGNNFGSNLSESYTTSLDAQWEVDLWGRIRAGISSSELSRRAVLSDYAAARQSISAQTAQAYFDLVASHKLQILSTHRLKSFEQTLKLVERRFETGTSSLGDIELARTDLETSRATLAERKDSRNRASRRLATLTGAYPNSKRSATTWPSLSRTIQTGIPSSLLMKRPDIDAAYQRIRSADASVTVAHRELYPSFSLTASGGRRSSILKELADSNFNVWSIFSNLSAPIIDGGNRRTELGAANARAKQALQTYRTTVLNAFEEVENALGSETLLLQREQATNQAFKAAQRAEEQILRSYESGISEILTLLDTQRRRFDAEEALINIKNLRYQNRVSLALALGKAY